RLAAGLDPERALLAASALHLREERLVDEAHVALGPPPHARGEIDALEFGEERAGARQVDREDLVGEPELGGPVATDDVVDLGHDALDRRLAGNAAVRVHAEVAGE